MIISNIWNNKSHIPNHQPVIHFQPTSAALLTVVPENLFSVLHELVPVSQESALRIHCHTLPPWGSSFHAPNKGCTERQTYKVMPQFVNAKLVIITSITMVH